jgi:hypothetical protein
MTAHPLNVTVYPLTRTGRQNDITQMRQRMMNAADTQDNGGVQVFVDGQELGPDAFGFPIARTPRGPPQVR